MGSDRKPDYSSLWKPPAGKDILETRQAKAPAPLIHIGSVGGNVFNITGALPPGELATLVSREQKQ